MFDHHGRKERRHYANQNNEGEEDGFDSGSD